MTAGNDGTPENDDPFAYLYRSEDGEPPADPAAGQQPGMPRTSHHQVQRVGERRPQPPQQQSPSGYGYPQQQSPSGYGYPPQQTQAQQQAYGRPPQQQQYGGGRQGYEQGGYDQGGHEQQGYDGRQQPPGPPYSRRAGGDGPQGGAAGRKGLLIGAVAVVAAVAIGIAFAMTNGSGDDKDKASDKPTTPVTSAAPSQTTPSQSAEPTPFDSKPTDASTLTLAGGAQISNEHPGASAADGKYVDHMTQVGASVTWTVDVPEDGQYTLFTYYGNAGDDATLTLTVNGKPRTDAVNLRNYGDYTDWAKAWHNHTYSWIDLNKGSNTVSLSCQQGNQCAVNLDQFELKQGQVTK
ncbi:carbohydrate-binding protein [Actinacidiphila alni]|uniref:carbohydrate-binding protein n=1 Tax=Actinacidiphila alni TaxID=380248 RepID=UPI0034523243